MALGLGTGVNLRQWACVVRCSFPKHWKHYCGVQTKDPRQGTSPSPNPRMCYLHRVPVALLLHAGRRASQAYRQIMQEDHSKFEK